MMVKAYTSCHRDGIQTVSVKRNNCLCWKLCMHVYCNNVLLFVRPVIS